jgi:phospholipase/carboxylesterase
MVHLEAPAFSRRRALLAAMASAPLACRQRPRPAVHAAAPAGEGDPWGGLNMARAGRMRDDERGGTAVVLLHGWGAPGDDLLPLAHELEAPRTRFFVPAAPLPEVGGGRAWWHLNEDDRPAHAWDETVPAGYQPHRHVTAARVAVQTILRTITARFAPEVLAIAGFSQGAMLSLDVALAADPPVDKVAALSGVLIADSVPALLAPRTRRPVVFASHGKHDPVLDFRAGEAAKDLLVKHGYAVTWRAFNGGHEIPRAIVEELRGFLFGGG